MPQTQAEHPQGPAFERAERVLEWPMMVLAVLFLAAVIVEQMPGVSAWWRGVADVTDSAVWALFAAEYALMLGLARQRARYVRQYWLNGVVVVVPALRFLRFARALRLVRLLRSAAVFAGAARRLGGPVRFAHKWGVTYLAFALVAVVFAGAYFVWCAERTTNEPFSSYGATLWWAAITASTIGYGDMAPRTAEGRAVALLFILLAVGLFGVVSATIAGYLVSQEQEHEQEAVMSHLHQITATLGRLDERLSSIETHLGGEEPHT